MDGQQPGALDKAAEVMIQVVKAEALGADAVRVMGEKLAAIEAELTDWEQIAVNTAFEGIEQGSTRISELVKAIKQYSYVESLLRSSRESLSPSLRPRKLAKAPA